MIVVVKWGWVMEWSKCCRWCGWCGSDIWKEGVGRRVLCGMAEDRRFLESVPGTVCGGVRVWSHFRQEWEEELSITTGLPTEVVYRRGTDG